MCCNVVHNNIKSNRHLQVVSLVVCLPCDSSKSFCGWHGMMMQTMWESLRINFCGLLKTLYRPWVIHCCKLWPPHRAVSLHPVRFALTHDLTSLSCTTPTAELDAEKPIITIFQMMLEHVPLRDQFLAYMIFRQTCFVSSLHVLMQFRVEFLLFVGMSLSETANSRISWLASCKPYGFQRL